MKKERTFLYFKLLVILFALMASSYAWFTHGTRMNMDGLSIKTRGVQNLSFSLDGGVTWDDDQSLNLDENFKFDSEITGDGINFYVPNSRREDGRPISFTDAVSGKNYIEFEIRFKSEDTIGLFLESESFVKPTAGDNNSDLFGTDVIRKSISGNFTRDLIAGAVRVAFIENDIVDGKAVPKNETKLVWAPNPNYELIKNANGYNFLLDSKNKQNYNTLDKDNLNPKIVRNIKDNVNASYDLGSASGDPMLLYLDQPNEVKSLTVRIWVEGNDREADTSLKGGVFRIYLGFTGLNKELNNYVPNVSVSNNKIYGFKEGMEYSSDFGNHWIDYKENKSPTFNVGDTVYVRQSETDSFFASNKIILNF